MEEKHSRWYSSTQQCHTATEPNFGNYRGPCHSTTGVSRERSLQDEANEKQHVLLYEQVRFEMLYCTRHCCTMCSEQKNMHCCTNMYSRDVVRDIVGRSRRMCSEQKTCTAVQTSTAEMLYATFWGIFFLHRTVSQYWGNFRGIHRVH
jgi:hypothetical protein